MSKDLLIYETGSGGDLRIISGDIALSETLFSQVFLAFFGGNLEASTKGNELPYQERFDYWANGLLWTDRPKRQFNSHFERALTNTAYNSSGRIEIENAAKKDLEVLNGVVNSEVSISVISESRLRCYVQLSGLRNGQESELQFIWNNAKQEIIIEETI